MSYSLCSTTGGNTGAIDCDITRGNPEVIAFGSASFAPSDYSDVATFDTNFVAKFKEAAGSADKLFAFPVIVGNTDKTVAAKFATLGYGLQVKILASKQGYEFDMLAGTTLEKQMLKFDGKTLPTFILDDKNQLGAIVDSQGNFKGAKYLVSVEPGGYGDAQNAKPTKVTISIVNGADFSKNAAFITTAINTNDLQGLVDVVLSEISGHTSNVAHIQAKIITTDLLNPKNIHDDYATELADESLWVASTGTNFATSLAITSVASTATGWDVTLDSTAFTALATGAKIKLNFAAPSVLDAADVTETEGIAVIITK